MDKREGIKKGTRITLGFEDYTIQDEIGRGGTGIVYLARRCENLKNLVAVKEIFPLTQEEDSFTRNADGEIICSDEDIMDRFKGLAREEAQLAAEINEQIPDVMGMRSLCDSAKLDGVNVNNTYLIMDVGQGYTLNDLVKIKRESSNDYMVEILDIFQRVFDAVSGLHQINIIHGDIKPENIFWRTRDKEALNNMVLLLDLGSACKDGIIPREKYSYSPGYIPPERRKTEEDLAVNKAYDTYSLVSMLYHMVANVTTDNEDELLYGDNNAIDSQLRRNLVTSDSAGLENPVCQQLLFDILAKGLRRDPEERYQSCEELRDDIHGLKKEIATVKKELDIIAKKNAIQIIQNHLYLHPLYQCVNKTEKEINVVVIGFGRYGKSFLDVCLQVGQIREKNLRVKIITDDSNSIEDYLKERPELENFFIVDNSVLDGEDIYGEIEFKLIKLKQRSNFLATDELWDALYNHFVTEQHPHYVFLDLENDKANKSLAIKCKEAVAKMGDECLITYVCEKQRKNDEPSDLIKPLYVNADIKATSHYSEIERMAFNTHLIWEKNLNVDYNIVRSEFKKHYNYNSCVSNVLSLKYKLHSIGIELDAVGFKEAAHLYIEALTNNQSLKDDLIWIEHRRWVTEKVCQGWRAIKNLEYCVDGKTKDDKAKKHVCIVRSRPDQKLAAEYLSNKNYEKWDNATVEELDQLDELDRMSVELHRMYARKAKVAKNQNLLAGNSITGIKELVEGNKKATIAFQEWYSCLKGIWSGDIDKVRLYKGLKNSFLYEVDRFSSHRKKAVYEHVKAFESIFYPILASMEYRDWKQDDVALIDNIPFVLTYTENACLAIPFVTGNNSDVFENVSAATLISPAQILYLYSVDGKQDVQELYYTIPCIVEYMKKKHFKAAVEFVISIPASINHLMNKSFVKKLVRIGEGKIRRVHLLALNGAETTAHAFESYLKQVASDKDFFAVEKNRTRLSYLFQGAGLYNSFASYEFASETLKFKSTTDCDMLNYINKSPYITVTDVMAFRCSSSESSNQPEFYTDYKELWEKYRTNRELWISLCNLLANYSKKNDIIVSFKKIDMNQYKDPQELRYIAPFTCNQSVSKIINFLKKHELIGQKSRVNGYTTDSCEIIIVDLCGYRNIYDKLFSKVYALMFPNEISFSFNANNREVTVGFDDLVVDQVQLPIDKRSEYKDLMLFFKDMGYIINFNIDMEGNVRFTYATKQIKSLLNVPERMLEIYTYHKVKELGQFDDVVSNYEVEWEGTEVKSKFDCVLTKGFRTLFVECKAQSKINQESYYKIASLVQQFGINATAVLVTDLQNDTTGDSFINTTQMKQGNMMNVVTVWEPEKLNSIDETLLKVAEGIYGEEDW